MPGVRIPFLVKAYGFCAGTASAGLVVAALATRVLPEAERRTGRFDLPGAFTGTLGVAALVYGLFSAATSQNGVSHWGDTKVTVSLVAAAVLLAAFAVIEVRSTHALLPIRMLRSRDRVLPDQPVRRRRAVRPVLLPHDLRAERVGLQPAEDRHRVPADNRHGHTGVRDRVAGGARIVAGHERIRAYHADRMTADHSVRVEAGDDEGEPAARSPWPGPRPVPSQRSHA
jgi:hypothetical protein